MQGVVQWYVRSAKQVSVGFALEYTKMPIHVNAIKKE